MFKTSVNVRSHCPLTSYFWITQPNIRTNLILSETRIMPKICTADDICLSLLVFTQLFFEVSRCQPAKPARTQNLTQNSLSGSFNVMHFGITEKPTTDCIWPYNKAGLISKVSEKIANENAFSTTPLSFDAPSPGNLHEYSNK